MMTQSEQVKTAAKILRKKLNMNNEDSIVLAHQIVEAINKPDTKVTNNPIPGTKNE